MSDGVRGYVRADERLLWTGKPQQGLRFSGGDVFMIPFSLVWGGGVLASFIAGGSSFSGAPFPFMLFPLIFGVVAVYITVGRFIHDAWIRSNIDYALTDRRILILRRGLGEELTALDIGRVETVRLKGRGDRGDIVFGQEPAWYGFGRRSFRSSFAMGVPSLSETPAFLGIDGARRLFDQIEGLRARAGGR